MASGHSDRVLLKHHWLCSSTASSRPTYFPRSGASLKANARLGGTINSSAISRGVDRKAVDGPGWGIEHLLADMRPVLVDLHDRLFHESVAHLEQFMCP